MEPPTVLLADADDAASRVLADALEKAGHRCLTAVDETELLERIRSGAPDLVLLDVDLPPQGGLRALERSKTISPSTLVVMVSAAASVPSVLAAFRRGAHDWLDKPVAPDRLLELTERASRLRSCGEQRRRLAEDLERERRRSDELERRLAPEDPFRRILGGSRAMRELVEVLREVARTDSTLLLTGESGTGKGLVARAIHDASERRGGPFVEANCVVYSEGILHSELFGHEKGAFTGAARLKRGRFELARGGTLFLDEIGEISPATQLLLLRVLQERTFERVGGEETLETDVRLLAATNRDLGQAVQAGTFRKDLFYRLDVIEVRLPPLRDHLEDVGLLAQDLLERYAARSGRAVAAFAPDALDALMSYTWPGNVRELENAIERAVVLGHGETVALADLPPALREPRGARTAPFGTLLDLERRRIRDVLEEVGGNRKQAAVRLGIHRSTLYAKLRRHSLLEGARAPLSCPPARQTVSRIATPRPKRS